MRILLLWELIAASGLDKILMGSVAEKVLHHSSIPLYIIPIKEDAEKK